MRKTCRRLETRLAATLLGVLTLMLGGCVHEWPDTPAARTATLRVRHELPWDIFEWTYPRQSRAAEESGLMARYIFAVYPADSDKEPPVKRVVSYREGTDREDFEIDLELQPGEWDIRVWSDMADQGSGVSPFYDPSDFTSVKYADPFVGGDTRKDAFAGTVRISVPDIIEDRWPDSRKEITLRRPLTAFAFVATDLQDFIEQEETRTRNEQGVPPSQLPPIALDDYSARISYTGFLPSVYNHFSDRPVDSATGMGFSTGVSRLNEQEALTGHDFVFINGSESTVRVSLDYYHKDGTHIARVAAFDIPVKRNRCTVVRGDFLTSKATGSTGIDPGFDGDFNIEYK